MNDIIEETEDNFGQKIHTLAKKTDGFSVVPPEKLSSEDTEYNNGRLHQDQRWIYVELDENPDFETFYSSLSYSLSKIVRSTLYKDNTLLLSFYGNINKNHCNT